MEPEENRIPNIAHSAAHYVTGEWGDKRGNALNVDFLSQLNVMQRFIWLMAVEEIDVHIYLASVLIYRDHIFFITALHDLLGLAENYIE